MTLPGMVTMMICGAAVAAGGIVTKFAGFTASVSLSMLVVAASVVTAESVTPEPVTVA